jgi:hypothetical protein
METLLAYTNKPRDNTLIYKYAGSMDEVSERDSNYIQESSSSINRISKADLDISSTNIIEFDEDGKIIQNRISKTVIS